MDAKHARPVRALVGFLEIVAAVLLCVAAVWAWRRGSVPYALPPSENPAVPASVDRWSGPWIGAAFGLALLAGLAVLDGGRRLAEALPLPWQTSDHGLSTADSNVDSNVDTSVDSAANSPARSTADE